MADLPDPPSQPAPAPPARKKRGSRLPILLGIAALVAAVVIVIVLVTGGDSDDTKAREPQTEAELSKALADGKVLAGPAQAPFAMRFTDDWEPLDAAALGQRSPRPIAGLRRSDGTGVITITVGGPVRGGINSLRRTLPGELKERFDDFRLISIRPVEIAAGRALYTSFVRGKSGQVQSNMVVPEGNRRSYSVDAVIRGDAKDTAQQVGAMLRTFDLVDRK